MYHTAELDEEWSYVWGQEGGGGPGTTGDERYQLDGEWCDGRHSVREVAAGRRCDPPAAQQYVYRNLVEIINIVGPTHEVHPVDRALKIDAFASRGDVPSDTTGKCNNNLNIVFTFEK